MEQALTNWPAPHPWAKASADRRCSVVCDGSLIGRSSKKAPHRSHNGGYKLPYQTASF